MRISAGPFFDPWQLAAIDALIRESPDHISLRFGRACCLEDLGRTAEAIAAYGEILRRDPKHFGALTNLGRMLFERERFDDAGPFLRAAAQLAPADHVALVNVADLHAQLDDHERAFDLYYAALAAQPDSLHAHLGLAKLFEARGSHERARAHRECAYARPRIWHFPYRGTAPAIDVLLLASAAGGDVACNLFFDDAVVQTCVLLADSIPPGMPLPPHHVVFNAIGDADRCAPSLAHAQTLVAGTRAPVINDPAAVARTGRVAIMQRLRDCPGVRAPRTQRIARADLTAATLVKRGFTFPLLLRTPAYHAGMHLALAGNSDALERVAATLPGRDLLAIEFIDVRGDGGEVRKYRVVAVDGQLYPVHLAVAQDWKVHYFSADAAESAAHRAEEATFLDDMPGVLGARVMRILQQVAATLELDYCGIDFSLDRDGNVVVFEANATMSVSFPQDSDVWTYRRPAVDRIIRAARTMIRARARSRAWAPPDEREHAIMRVRTDTIDLPRDGGVMRVFIARPDDDRPYPALAFYSDIFQMTESTQRMAVRFASYGFIVAAPEIYWRFEPPGTAIAFDDPGRDRGMDDAKKMRVRDFDDDIAVLIAFLESHAEVVPGAIGAVGFCLGGHLAFRAAFSPAVKATVCLYPTGLHDGELAHDADAGSLALAARIRGELLLIFGTADPHTDAAGRAVVADGLAASGIRYRIALYDAAHAFMRDVGPRWDPQLTDVAFAEAIALFRTLSA